MSLPSLCFSQKKDLGSFNRINVANGIDVQLILEKKEAIDFELSGIALDQITYEITDKTLKIRAKRGKNKDAKIKVKLSYTDLSEIISAGEANVWSEEDIYTDHLKFNIGKGGGCRLRVYADTITATVGEGGILFLKGETHVLNVKVGTASTFSGYDLESEKAYVNANSGGKAKIAVSQYLEAIAATKGFIGYIGDPEKIDEKVSLGGEVVKTYKE